MRFWLLSVNFCEVSHKHNWKNSTWVTATKYLNSHVFIIVVIHWQKWLISLHVLPLASKNTFSVFRVDGNNISCVWEKRESKAGREIQTAYFTTETARLKWIPASEFWGIGEMSGNDPTDVQIGITRTLLIYFTKIWQDVMNCDQIMGTEYSQDWHIKTHWKQQFL